MIKPSWLFVVLSALSVSMLCFGRFWGTPPIATGAVGIQDAVIQMPDGLLRIGMRKDVENVVGIIGYEGNVSAWRIFGYPIITRVTHNTRTIDGLVLPSSEVLPMILSRLAERRESGEIWGRTLLTEAIVEQSLAERWQYRLVWRGLFGFVITVIGVIVAGMIAITLVSLLIRRSRLRRGACSRCGYELGSLVRCPECGADR